MAHFAALVGAAILVVAASQAPPGDLRPEFERYKREFQKSYEGPADEEAHFEAFVKNYVAIQRHNAEDHSYKLGLNQFADLSVEEFSLTHFGMKAPVAEELWGGLQYLGQHVRGSATPPASVDWSTKGAVTKPKNQGRCGSCWAFSSTGAMEGAWEIATGKLVSLSEQNIVDCANVSFEEMGCGGGNMPGAFRYSQENGVCTEDSYPYKALTGACVKSNCTLGIPVGGIAGYKAVPHNDEQALMDAVSQQPVSVAIEADQLSFQLYTGGVLAGACGEKLDHGVLAVGYGTDNGKDYWLVKNSWGAYWGEHGYVRILRGKPGAGECGIKMDASYPVARAVPAPATFII